MDLYFVGNWHSFVLWLNLHTRTTCWAPEINDQGRTFFDQLLKLSQILYLDDISMAGLCGRLWLLLILSRISSRSSHTTAHILGKHIYHLVHVHSAVLHCCHRVSVDSRIGSHWISALARDERILLSSFCEELMRRDLHLILHWCKHGLNHFSQRCGQQLPW